MSGIDVEAYEEEWADEEPRRRRRGRKKLSREARERIEAHEVGQVVGVDKGWLTVLYEGEIVPARYGGAMRGRKAVVGDRVRVRPPRHDTDVARVLDRLERSTVLTRTPDDASDEERVVVANADQVCCVLAADHLERGAGFLDRVIVAALAGGLAPLACINKMDLVVDEPDPAGEGAAEVAAVTDRYEQAGVGVVHTSAVTGAGLEDLRRVVAGTWTVMSGHSGVGKSSLFNRLVPEADREIGDTGRYGGRHTTVATRAMRIPDTGAWLVDTPGVRSFGLGALGPRELAAHFPELSGLDCSLDDCLHDGEPGCTVAGAEIPPGRLRTYRRLLSALRGGEAPTSS